ncbi:MAG: RNA polymerase sigma factor [Lachnospiraceae bacterium]|nr:RNA polymerase sigma factor [Lachnospiraceae bacterium]
MELRTESDLEQLVRQYQEPLLRYCTGILGNSADAEDAVQITFIKAWKKRSSRKKENSLKSWLFRIAYRTSVDLLRSRKSADEIPDNLAENAAEEGEAGFSEETAAALGALSVLDRAIVEERILEEMSYEEMAEIHHLPAGTFRRRYSRARRKLQTLLTKEDKQNE